MDALIHSNYELHQDFWVWKMHHNNLQILEEGSFNVTNGNFGQSPYSLERSPSPCLHMHVF